MDQERRTAVSNQQRLAPEDIATRAFSSSFRGLSESEVRAYLKRVADEMLAAQAREQELRAELGAAILKAQHREPLDETELLEALGEETANLLRSAREAARDIRAKAEEAGVTIRAEAQAESDRVIGEAGELLTTRTAEAELAKTAILDSATAGAEQIRVDAETSAAASNEQAADNAAAVIEAAKLQGRSMVEEAKSLRERIVADLGHRRGLLQSQIAELRAGREHLLDAYRVVKQTFLEATDALSQVEKKAAIAKPPPVDPGDITAMIEGDPAIEDVAEGLSDAVAPGVAARVVADAAPQADTTEVASTESDSGAVSISTDIYPSDIDVFGIDAALVESSSSTIDQVEPKAVNDLFARIRAQAEPAAESELDAAPHGPETHEARSSRESAPAETGTVLNADGQVDAVAALSGSAGDATPTGDPTIVPEAADADADAGAGDSVEPEVPVALHEEVEVAPADDGAEAAHMMEAVAALLPVAAKRSKRASQDEQNEVLDRLRRHKGRLVSAAIVAPQEANVATWLGVLRPMIDDAYQRGHAAGSPSGPENAAIVCPDELGLEVVAGVVGSLHQRIALAIDSGDADGATDRVNARFREWKSQQLDDLLTDALIGAFVGGRFDAIPSGSLLQWVVAEQGCCSDCADNALETVLKGAEFPTGHALPPAHPGCRCVIAAG